MATTTTAVIRDQMLALLEALVPTALPNTAPDYRFKRYRGDGPDEFMKWADGKPDAAFRRFFIRAQLDRLSDVANTDVMARIVTFLIVIAYPQTASVGALYALSRDDIMASDLKQIEQTVGLPGYGNFPDASWVSASGPTRVEGKACDFIVIEQTMRFYRSFP